MKRRNSILKVAYLRTDWLAELKWLFRNLVKRGLSSVTSSSICSGKSFYLLNKLPFMDCQDLEQA